jgi:hypothetical protein
MTTGQWYRLSMVWTYTSNTVNEVRSYLDGVQQGTLSNVAFGGGTIAPRRIELGLVGTPGGSKVAYLDDIYCDDGAHTDGDPGDICVTAKLPSADSQANWDTDVGAATGAGTRYTNCAERPLSATNGRSQTANAQADEVYSIQASTAGDVSLAGATLLGHLAWIYWKFGAGTQGTAQIWDDGARTNLTGVTSNTFAYVANTSVSYPSSADAIGVRSGGNAADTLLYECGIFVPFIPGSAQSPLLPILQNHGAYL